MGPMFFNSFVFIFAFLPVTLIGFGLLFRIIGQRAALLWLVAASLFFYGWWNPSYLLLLGASTIFNFLIGQKIASSRSKTSLGAGIAANLAVLGFFKYADFFIGTVNTVAATQFPLLHIVLPLAISFITFQKIAFLVDCYKGRAEEKNFLDFAVFVSFFPQLIAGPIVHYREMMPQFKSLALPAFKADLCAAGLMLFSIGLFKKTVLADSAAIYANAAYTTAEAGNPLALLDAWAGIFAYSFQIYFDFSGYSDMAIGLALLFGIRLPVNFLSPYRATGFIDFWRRWHITLSRFLRDYLYIPLGGNRVSPVRRSFNIALTMLLGGLWHGASWTFVLWGGLHGLLIALNHGLRQLPLTGHIPRWLCIAVTFFAVTLLWIPFRSETLSGAQSMLAALSGQFSTASPTIGLIGLGLLGLCAAVVFLLPGSMALLRLQEQDPEIHDVPMTAPLDKIVPRFSPCLFYLLVTSALLLISFLFMQSNLGKTFIYFDF